jgi:peptidyl-prolyl cis-trans isomerase SurA
MMTDKHRKLMMYLRQPLLALAIILGCICQANAQQVADRIVAVVGDNPILQSDIEMQFLQLKTQDEGLVSEEVKCQIFDKLMLEKLFLAQAIIDSITASPDEVDSELERRIRYFISIFGNKEKLEEYYGKSILELKDEFREDIEKQLISEKMRGKALGALKVSPQEVKDFFNSIPRDSVPYFNSELELAELVMYPVISDEQKKIAKDKITKIRTDIMGGSDFSLQAILYSKDPGSASDGGNLGIIERGELVPEFEAVAYRLKEGELSEPVETPFGFHLIMVDEKRGDKLKVRHILIKPELTNNDVMLCKNTMDSIHHLLVVDSLLFKDAVKTFSMEDQSKNVGGLMTNQKTGTPFFEKADIDGSLIFSLDKIKVGEYTDVLPHAGTERTGEQKRGYRIVYLKSETKPHKASLELDYPKIQAQAKSAKTQAELDKWISLYRSRTYIRVEDAFKTCPEAAKWVKK